MQYIEAAGDQCKDKITKTGKACSSKGVAKSKSKVISKDTSKVVPITSLKWAQRASLKWSQRTNLSLDFDFVCFLQQIIYSLPK